MPDKKEKRLYCYVTPEEYSKAHPSQLTYKILWDGLTEKTTSHGLPHIANAHGIIKKTVWIFIVLGTLVGLGYHNYTIFDKYFSYPVSVNLELGSNITLEFPAITICNMNIIRKHFLAQSNLTTLISAEKQGGPSNVGKNNRRPPGAENGFGEQSDESALYDQTLEELSVLGDQEKRSMGHQLNDLILSCEFNGYECNRSYFETFFDPHLGNCFIFNSGWTLGVTSFAYNSGPRYGAQFTLNVEQDAYIGSLSPSVGVKVLIHNQTVMPFPSDQGTLVSPGQITQIGIRQLSISRLGGNYGTCMDPTADNKNLNMYEELHPVSYSQKACSKTCFQNQVIETCNCHVSYSRPPKRYLSVIKPCRYDNDTEQDCLDEVTTKFSNGDINCICPPSCSETVYEQIVSTAMWPSDSYKQHIAKTLQKSNAGKLILKKNNTDEYNKNLARVDVFYQDLNYEILTEYPAYDIGPFLSDFGGCLGLWIGWSILTVFEFIEIFLDMTVLTVDKKTSSKQRAVHASSMRKFSQIDVDKAKKNTHETTLDEL